MKRLVTFCLAAMLIGLLVGCGGSGGGYPGGNFLVTLSGEAWNPPLAWFYVSNGTLYIWAFQSQANTSPYVEIIIPGAVAGGNYDLSTGVGSNPWAVYGPDQGIGNGYWTYSPASGTISLTTLNATRCAGTFDFTGKNPGTSNTIHLTAGAFNVGHGSPP
jgi:Family of unknown function (DUF6252)